MGHTNKHNQQDEVIRTSGIQAEPPVLPKGQSFQPAYLLDLFNALTSEVSALIAAIDTDYRYTYFNQAYRIEIKRLLNFDLQPGMTVKDVYQGRPEQLAFALKQWSRPLGGEYFKEVVKFLRSETTENFYEVTYTPVKDGEGLISGAVLVAKNITQRLLDEHSLSESEIRLQQLFDNIVDGLAICEFLFDENGKPKDYRILDTNPKLTTIIGSEREKLIGSNYSTLVPFLNNLDLNCLMPVALNGEAIHFEEFSPTLHRYFEGSVYSLRKNYFAIVLSDITERKSAQQNILWLASFPEQNPMPVVEIDYDLEFVYQNPAARHFFSEINSNEQSQFLSEILDIVHAFKTDMAKEKTKDARIGNTWFHLTFYHMPQQKRVRIYSTDISDRVKAQNELIDLNQKLEATVHLRTEELEKLNQKLSDDILRQIISEKALEAEHKRFTDVLEMLPVYIILLTPSGHINFANKYFEDSIGRIHQGLNTEISSYRNNPEDIEKTFRPLHKGQPNTWEWTSPQNCVYTVHDYPYSDVDGSPLVLEIGFDITEMLVAQKRLQENAIYNRSLIEANLDFLVTIDQDGYISDVNNAAILATGFSRDELIGSQFDMHFEDREAANRGVQQVLKTGSVRNYELSLKHKDGHTIPVAYNASFYTDLEGKIIGIFAGARDLTELRQKENQLLELNRALGEAVAHEVATRELLIQAEKFSAMGRMLASVTHEINNPLQTITNCQYLIASDIPSNSQAHQFLDMAISETTRISKLVGELKDLYRQPQNFDFAPIHLPVLLENVHNLLETQFAAKHVIWELQYEDEAVPEMWVEGIEDQLKQVVINLSMNAIEAMQPKGGLLKVLLARGKNNEIGILFSDTGPGISPEIRSKLFEPFSSTKKQGLGLGLSICYNIVQRHHGHIEVSSVPGEGATFEVWLPAYDNQKQAER